MDMTEARKFAALTLEKREAEAKLKEIKAEMSEMETRLIETMVEEQIPKLQFKFGDEGITIFPRTMLWVRPKGPAPEDRQAVVKALKKAHLGDFVREDYNTSTLSAWARERLAEGTDLPPSITAVVELQPQVTLQGRRTTATPESKSAAALETLRR